MTSPRPIFDGFLRNPFGSEMKSIGGMGGEGGVLENIQQQVADNGEALQALQGGIGGLPNTPFRNPGDLLDLSTFKPPIAPVQDELRLPTGFEPLPTPSIVDAASDIDSQLRAEYEKAVADAKRQRAEGFMGRMVLPGEMSFEDFKQNQMAVANSGAPLQTQMDQNLGTAALQNLALVQSPVETPMNPSIDIFNIKTDPRRLMTMNNDFFDPRGLAYGNVGNPIPQPIYERPGPDIGMDQLFSRAFAGKPI